MNKRNIVRVIPAKLNKDTLIEVGSIKKRRVAAYARVSTDEEEQQSSYIAQVEYYENYIKNNQEWEFVKVYADEGITGTSIKKRDGFKSMVADAFAGKIDLILTKSISRFARNTVDSLSTIRDLKEHNVEVFFEKENINTFDGKGELLLTILSSLSQEESRSISQNVLWGKKRVMEAGKYSIPYSRFLGYDKGMVINKSEAKIVKLIYQLFLKGNTLRGIAKELTLMHIKTPGKKTKWSIGSVKSILTNEKYCGDAKLQKTYIKDYLTKKQIKNNGERTQYLVEDGHEPIIDKKTFNIVQDLIGTRNKYAVGEFCGKIICGECGSSFGAKVWHSTDKYKKIIYRCNGKYESKDKGDDTNHSDGGRSSCNHGGCGSNTNHSSCGSNTNHSRGSKDNSVNHLSRGICSSPHFTEDELKSIIVNAINEKFKNKDIVIKECDKLIKTLSAKIFDIDKLKDNLNIKANTVNALIEENQHISQDQNIYNEKYNLAEMEYIKAEEKLKKAESAYNENLLLINRIKTYKEIISKGKVLKEFDKELFNEVVEVVKIYKDEVKVVMRGE